MLGQKLPARRDVERLIPGRTEDGMRQRNADDGEEADEGEGGNRGCAGHGSTFLTCVILSRADGEGPVSRARSTGPSPSAGLRMTYVRSPLFTPPPSPDTLPLSLPALPAPPPSPPSIP